MTFADFMNLGFVLVVFSYCFVQALGGFLRVIIERFR